MSPIASGQIYITFQYDFIKNQINHYSIAIYLDIYLAIYLASYLSI